MARNQVRSGTLVEAKIAPAISEACRPQDVHRQRSRVLRLPQPGRQSRAASASETQLRHRSALP